MKLLKEIFHHPGLNLAGVAIRRTAVRAIIRQERSLLMIYSAVNGDYKFPGGGVKDDETHAAALARELDEECGAQLAGIVGELGNIIEYARPFEVYADLFQMTSFYYFCRTAPVLGAQRLDAYEQALDFRPVWIDIDQAWQVNTALMRAIPDSLPRWTERDTFVLDVIRNRC